MFTPRDDKGLERRPLTSFQVSLHVSRRAWRRKDEEPRRGLERGREKGAQLSVGTRHGMWVKVNHLDDQTG